MLLSGLHIQAQPETFTILNPERDLSLTFLPNIYKLWWGSPLYKTDETLFSLGSI